MWHAEKWQEEKWHYVYNDLETAQNALNSCRSHQSIQDLHDILTQWVDYSVSQLAEN